MVKEPKNIKVLMVDDDQMLLDLYTERLKIAGFEVIGASNGEDCLKKVNEVRPDIVLLDIMMPKVNGYDTLAALKSDPQTKDIPVIILSALVRDVNKSRALEAGADDYIIKSEVLPVDVISKIEAVLAKYQKNSKDTSKDSKAEKEDDSKKDAPPIGEVQFEPSQEVAKNTGGKKNSSGLIVALIIGIILVIIFCFWLFLTKGLL